MERNPIMYEMRIITKLFLDKVKVEAQKSGVNPRYFMILKYLANHKDIEISQVEISNYLEQKPSSISVTSSSNISLK